MKKLWTRDFTILTLGTVVSIFGNTFAGFAINLKVLDYSGSIFLFVLFMVVFNLPKIFVPMLAGPVLDSFSRRKSIYILDFISAGALCILYFILRDDYFNYGFFLVVSFVMGTIYSVYMVAYESLYPLLVSEGNFRKAYSVSSVIMPLSMVMMPVAAFLYDRVGIGPVLIISSGAFFIAACVETRIRVNETHLRKKEGRYSLGEFKSGFIEGYQYIRGEKGLMVITAYFFVSTFAWSSHSLVLPFFRSAPHLGVMLYSVVMGAAVLGRVIGGTIQYKLELPKEKKFAIAMTVYVSICFLEMIFLFTPIFIMAIISFTVGILSVTSYNIRISTTQSYIPDAKRARFNGTFQMFMHAGAIVGQLIAGALGDLIPIRAVIIIFHAICLCATYLIIWRGRQYVKPIYNRLV